MKRFIGIMLILFLSALNGIAGTKMAFFRGDSFLSWVDSAAFNIGSSDPYKVKCKIRLSPQDGWTCWLGGAPLHLGNIGYYEAGNFHPGEAGWALGNSDWLFSGHRIDDNAVHTLEIERTAGHVLTITVDDVMVFSESNNYGSLNGYPGEWRSQWQLGGYEDGTHLQKYFTGYIGEFELYINGKRKIYLPLTDDLLDHSGNNITISNAGAGVVRIIDLDNFYLGGSVETLVADSVGNWMLYPQSVIVAGNITNGYGLNKIGAVIYCEGMNLAAAGNRIKTAELNVSYVDIGGGLGLGGSGVKAKIRAQDTPNPVDVTDANALIASAKTDAYIAVDDQTYTDGQTVAYDISSIVTELLAQGNLSRINLIFDDNEGRTTLSDGCYIGTDYSVYIELEDSNGLRVPWRR